MSVYAPNVLLAMVCFILAVRSFQGKGIPLNNSVLYMSEEERSKMDLRPYYRQSGIVFVLLGMANALLAMGSILSSKALWAGGMIIIALAALYGILSSVRKEGRPQ